MYRIKSDLTHPRLTNKFHTSIVLYVICQQLCIPQDYLMIAYTGQNMLQIEKQKPFVCVMATPLFLLKFVT
jgi:hypothetical protein